MPTYVFYAYDSEGKDSVALRFTPPDTWEGKKEVVARWKENLEDGYIDPPINLIEEHERIPELVFHQRIWAEVEKKKKISEAKAQRVLKGLSRGEKNGR
jgi:hypothetical protein